MAYQEFAYFYDEFNGAADYDALFAYVTGELKAHGIQDGIVADFGCGTGELTLMLAQAGYDMIGIDVSEEMLSVLRDKADALGLPLTNPMLLCQDLLQLDLYGTIRAADGLKLYSQSAVLMDGYSGRVLYGKRRRFCV